MTSRRPGRRTNRRVRIHGLRVAGVLVVLTVIAAALGYQLPVFSTASATSPSLTAPVWSSPAAPVDSPPRVGAARGGVADGALPDGTTVDDDELAGVANLDADLLDALRRATDAAAADGVELLVESGWRSSAYQERLLREAVAEHGSVVEAARWVATPDASPHVSGDAVDIGSSRARAWLAEHGATYGLCRIYRNEPWHFELRPEAIDDGCPAPYADPTHDPRMQ